MHVVLLRITCYLYFILVESLDSLDLIDAGEDVYEETGGGDQGAGLD